jgi:hypothetical protein
VEELRAGRVGVELIVASYPQEPVLAVDKIRSSKIQKDEMQAVPMETAPMHHP